MTRPSAPRTIALLLPVLVLTALAPGCRKQSVSLSPEMASSDEALYKIGEIEIKRDMEKGILGAAALAGAALRRRPDAAIGALLGAGIAAHTLALAVRWERVGHGPFISMFEVLSSNVWSLTLLFLAAFVSVRAVRPAAAVALPVIFVLMAWMLVTHPDDGHLPATYATLWLYAHVAFGKVFLGALPVATAVSALMLVAARRPALAAPDEAAREALVLRFLLLAFVFESLMLVTGVVWAQDAWGRVWSPCLFRRVSTRSWKSNSPRP